MGRLANKETVVTGASKGIGAGTAKPLAAEGADLVVNYSKGKGGREKVVGDCGCRWRGYRLKRQGAIRKGQL